MRLVKVNLKNAQEHRCPNIKVGTRYTYLCKIGGQWGIGSFSREWYGLNFYSDNFSGGNGIQFDAPGFNSSEWEEVYQIKDN